MDAAAYVRVSSLAQDHASQKHAVERAAQARGDTVSSWYSEKRSAKTTARPVLDQVRADARAGHLRRLYVYRLDRLTRSGIRDTLEVVEELQRHGCEVVSVADGFDLHGPAAEVVVAVMSWAAKMERLAINERIATARTRVEAEGGRWGRPPRMTEKQRARARQLHQQGRTVRAISAALGVPKATVGRAVKAAAQARAE
jgi:DNA invertase Pin-like site-specific DNA recombinase